MRHWPKVFGALALLLCLTAVGPAHAATISYSDSCPMVATNWSNTLDITLFDPSLGTLTGINFYLAGSAEGNVRFESLDAQPATVHCVSTAEVTLSRPDFTPIAVTLPIADTYDDVTAFDGVIDFGGTSGRTYLGLTAQDSETVDSPPPLSDLVLFTGPGTISLPVRAVGSSHATGAGNLITQFQTWAAAELTVTYTYEPTPTGACCDLATGDCTITTQAECGFTWLGADVPCNLETCPVPPPPTGACCDHATGDCVVVAEIDCPFDWLGADVPCNVETCPPPPPETGACCDHATGDCTVTTQAGCGFDWLGAGVPCNLETCPPPPPPTGACCDHATGNCTITTQVDCAFDWLGVDVPCNLETCEPPVPTERASWGQIKNIYR